jgi:hypothetical protein
VPTGALTASESLLSDTHCFGKIEWRRVLAHLAAPAPDIAGLTTNGGSALPNGGDGVRIDGSAHGNVVGGSRHSVIPQNTFSGNAGYGLVITGQAHDNRVFSSFIGTKLAGVNALGHREGGVLISGRAYRNSIGNAKSRPANLISGNTGNGVTLRPALAAIG